MKKENSSHYKRSKKLKALRFGQYTLNAIGIIVLCYGVYEAACLFLNYKRCETSNDAQIEQYISPINIRVPGYVKKGEFMRTGLPKQKKTTDIWFDEKDPLIHIRTHNTDLKKRLAAYAEQHPDVCRQTDADPETGCMEFDIAKGRFSFRLTAPYSEERREATRRYARENSTTNLLK